MTDADIWTQGLIDAVIHFIDNDRLDLAIVELTILYHIDKIRSDSKI